MDFQVTTLGVEGAFTRIFYVLEFDVLGCLFGQVDWVVQFHLCLKFIFGRSRAFCNRYFTVETQDFTVGTQVHAVSTRMFAVLNFGFYSKGFFLGGDLWAGELFLGGIGFIEALLFHFFVDVSDECFFIVFYFGFVAESSFFVWRLIAEFLL